ncbi:MAG: AAA family ATPase [Azospirillaceae bacterium]|nr:AAA family ATPase [Azospirillaceae bacterium]
MKVGGKADGDAFFNRTRERTALWRILENDHITISGPRRLGKTSLLQKLADEAEDKGWIAALVDVEGLGTPKAFFEALDRHFPDVTLSATLQRGGEAIRRRLTGLQKVSFQLPGGLGGAGLEFQDTKEQSWIQDARTLQHRLAPQPLLILVDELSVFLETLLTQAPAEAPGFLAFLRAWRQQSDVNCRFVFCGSIGLNALLERHRLGTLFNDCYDFRLDPFLPADATAMLTELLRRERWTADPACLAHLCHRIGWLSPFYLNLLLMDAMTVAEERVSETRAPERILIPSDIDDAYDRLLLTRSRFIHWVDRLKRDLDVPSCDFAMATLNAIAKSGDGLTKRTLLARLQKRESDPDRRAERLETILLKLEEDGYIDSQGEKIQFLSFLLRDYWKKNHAR